MTSEVQQLTQFKKKTFTNKKAETKQFQKQKDLVGRQLISVRLHLIQFSNKLEVRAI